MHLNQNDPLPKKLREARESGLGEMPSWFDKEMEDAKADSKREIPGRH
jgi:hypothetical protein